LALHQWLREEGLPSELRIGVRKDDGELRAHAWVELGGLVVNDGAGAVAAFTPLRSLASIASVVRASGDGSLIAGATRIDVQAAQWQ